MQLPLSLILAYLDNILDPEYHDRIERQLEQNPEQMQLVHRIDDLLRHARPMKAEVLDASGLDPNTVAGFLDLSLSPQQSADCQQLMLDSDRYLAEVACCHQILSKTLGEPAQVSPELRDRVYSLLEHAQPESVVSVEGNAIRRTDSPEEEAAISQTAFCRTTVRNFARNRIERYRRRKYTVTGNSAQPTAY